VSSHTIYDLNGAVAAMANGGRRIGKAITRALVVDRSAHNISVNAVGPGLTRTDLSKPLWADTTRTGDFLSTVPKGRVAEPEKTGGAVLFLSSKASDFIAGQCIYVDGGYLAT
jgi:gluconate 5-dehydrogenase